MSITENDNKTKCEGIGCAYKQSCGRFLRPEGDHQAWASYYALADDDCDYFEAVNIPESEPK